MCAGGALGGHGGEVEGRDLAVRESHGLYPASEAVRVRTPGRHGHDLVADHVAHQPKRSGTAMSSVSTATTGPAAVASFLPAISLRLDT